LIKEVLEKTVIQINIFHKRDMNQINDRYYDLPKRRKWLNAWDCGKRGMTFWLSDHTN